MPTTQQPWLTEPDIGVSNQGEAMEATGRAVVTGASRGIGRAVALELAKRGYDTIATMRNPADGSELAADLAQMDDVKGTLTVEKMDVNDPELTLPSDLRVIVNNAGVEDDNLPVETMPAATWRKLFETNVFGLVNVTSAAVPILRTNGGGVICNVTSSSILAPVPFLGAYRASKAAVSILGESLQAEVGRFGIRVVEIMPGPIVTDMLTGSERPSPAIDDANYHDLAEQLWSTRSQIHDQYTPAEEAARRIANAIEDDKGPLRYGCDPMSEGMLAGWRSVAGDQNWLAPMFEAFG
jgi:NAD(P)-dependent dehydrogenase (short-subunit alcohol dehydrogenase family)